MVEAMNGHQAPSWACDPSSSIAYMNSQVFRYDGVMASTRTAPRWLTADEQETWRSFLAMQKLIRETLERQLQQDAQMPMTYYIILAMLSEAPDRTMRMTELAALAGTSQSQLSHAATRLEESGWITRRRCVDDKRGYLAVLTDEGFDVLTSAAPGHVECVRTVLFDALSTEQVRQLKSISDAVTEHSGSG